MNISELNQKYTLDELSLKVGFGLNDLKDKLALTQVTQEFMDKLKKDAEDREQEVPTVMNFAVSKEQEKTINEALARVQGKSKGEKLYSLCSVYLKQK